MLAMMIGPMMPHLGEECWARLGYNTLLADQPWPEAEPALLVDDTITIAVQVNGKRRDELTISRTAGNAEIEAAGVEAGGRDPRHGRQAGPQGDRRPAEDRECRRLRRPSRPVDGARRRSAFRAARFCARLALGLARLPALAGCAAAAGSSRSTARSAAASVEHKIAQVEFAPIPGRNGQRIRNELMFKAYGGGNADSRRATGSKSRSRKSSTTTLVLRDGTSAGQIYQIDAKFQLVDIATKKVMLEGFSQSRATSERFANVFSNVRAGDEAQERASKTIATDLKARLAGFLSTVQA